MIATTQPTTVPEFRRLANAFLTGSRFPAGTQVYVVMSRAGLMPINKVIAVSSPTAEQDVAAALADPAPPGFDQEERADQAVYMATVPAGTRLRMFVAVDHGATGYTFLPLRSSSYTPPSDATLGDIECSSLHITWNNHETSIYDLRDVTDAVFLTRGAVELFDHTVYQAMYGTDYVDRFRAKLSPPGESAE